MTTTIDNAPARGQDGTHLDNVITQCVGKFAHKSASATTKKDDTFNVFLKISDETDETDKPDAAVDTAKRKRLLSLHCPTLGRTGLEARRKGGHSRQHSGYFFVRQHAHPIGRYVWEAFGLAGSFFRSSNPHDAALLHLEVTERGLTEAEKDTLKMKKSISPSPKFEEQSISASKPGIKGARTASKKTGAAI